jgi:HK97 family phage portal protein
MSVLSQDVSKLPLRVWRKEPNGARSSVSIKDRGRAGFVSYTLYKPNTYQTATEFLQQLMASLLINGNAYVYVTRNGGNLPDEMRVIHPSHVSPWVTPEGEVYYNISPDPLTIPEIPETSLIPARFVMHFRHQTYQHPLIGISPLQAAAYSASTGLSILRQSSAFFRRMARPSGVLQSPRMLDGDVADRLRTQWQQVYGDNPGNAGKVAVLEDGLEWKPMTMTAADSQLIEQLRFTVEDVARVYRVPIFMLGDMTKASYRNSEVLMRNYYAGSLSYYCRSIEDRMNVFHDLGEDFEVRFDLDELFRAESDVRMNTLKTAVQGGIMKPDEARGKEGLGPVPGGNEVYVQQQMIPLRIAAEGRGVAGATPPNPQVSPPQNDEDDSQDTDETENEDGEDANGEVEAAIAEQAMIERLVSAVQSELTLRGATGGGTL